MQQGLMSQQPLAKRVRKGTTSCIQCRNRKIRCKWPSEGADICQNCLARSRTCELQVHMTPTSVTVGLASRARIARLEQDVSSLWTALHAVDAKFNCVPTGPSPLPLVLPRTQNGSATYDSRPAEASSDSDSSDLSPTNPPTHLLQLFDNVLLGTHPDASNITPRLATASHKVRGVSALGELLPSREDMLTITAHAASWLSLYNSLFPMTSVMRSGDAMLSQYDSLKDSDAYPVKVAALLLAVALTVQVVPDEIFARAVKSIKDAPSFIKDVSDTVERVVVLDDALAGTLDGIEATLLFLRLQLGRGRVKKMWLILRRVIALAEMIGLPRAAVAVSSCQDSLGAASSAASPGAILMVQRAQRAEVWISICAIDRITSMMWALPLATRNFPLPKPPILDPHGEVIPQSFLYSLAEIASRILELDDLYSSGRPLPELSCGVNAIDQELQNLISLTPKDWWKIEWSEMSIHAPLQYWHQYFTVRTHLQHAMTYSEGQQFALSSFVTCLNASDGLARRYISLRPLLPAGLFANWVIDLQSFTAAVFLLLATYRITHNMGSCPQGVNVAFSTDLANQVMLVMDSADERVGGDFTHAAADALRSLSLLLQQPQESEAQRITLNLPLVGKIHVSRKSYVAKTLPSQHNRAPTQPEPRQPMQPFPSDGSSPVPLAMPYVSSDLDMTEFLSYSMEIPENNPFLTDDAFETEQWLTWT